MVDGLPDADRRRLIPQLSVFRAEIPELIFNRGDELTDVLFPIDAVFSTTAELHHGDVYEVAATGRQGVVGAEIALGLTSAPRSVMAQIEGSAARIPCAAFLRCIELSRALSRAVYAHFARRLFIAEQFVACNFAHDVTQRCARWLLMLRDELGRDRFELRHEFLGMMLGLAPEGVKEATAALRRMEVIRYEDEVIELLDVEELAESACGCYEAQRHFAPFA